MGAMTKEEIQKTLNDEWLVNQYIKIRRSFIVGVAAIWIIFSTQVKENPNSYRKPYWSHTGPIHMVNTSILTLLGEKKEEKKKDKEEGRGKKKKKKEVQRKGRGRRMKKRRQWRKKEEE